MAILQTSPAGATTMSSVGMSEAHASAVSWGAIIAGAVGAAALSFFLFLLGSGLGLSSISAWSGEGVGASAIGWSTIIWLTVSQILAAALGGYLAGRLRTRWAATNSNEVYFRDTAHGFLAWALSLLLSLVLLGSAASSLVGGAGQAIGSVAGGATSAVATAIGGGSGDTAGEGGSNGFVNYYVHSLLRQSDAPQSGFTLPGTGPSAQEAARLTQEITPIVVDSIRRGEVTEADRDYVTGLIANYTGISQDEARARIDATVEEIRTRTEQAEQQAREAAETARVATAYTMLWIAVALLIGAFTSALFATFGGRLRDTD